MVRGNVARPTHHQRKRNMILDHVDMVAGSRAGPDEKIRATRLTCADLRVTVAVGSSKLVIAQLI